MRNAFLLSIMICFALVATAQKKLNLNDVSLSWQVVENQHGGKNQFLSKFVLVSPKVSLPSSGWSLYFNLPRTIDPATVTPPFQVEHINGDLFRIFPKAQNAFAKAKPIEISFAAGEWAVNFTDAPSGPYLLLDADRTKGFPVRNYKIIPSTEPRQYLRFASDKIGLITPADVYQRQASIQPIAADQLPPIFPTPAEITRKQGFAELSANTVIESDAAFGAEEIFLKNALQELSVPAKEPSTKIRLVKADLPEEAYKLTVQPGLIEISAGSGAGIFYGIQSLESMFPLYSWAGTKKMISIPAMEVNDKPRFAYRSFMLDIARNFHSKEELKKIIQLLALYKVNTLHLHFNDDEGWRIQMPSFPELTAVGSKRGAGFESGEHLQPSYGSGPDITLKRGSGSYTTDEFIDILHYARDRHIQVIPEVETPGHARAAIVSMKYRYKQLMNAGKKSEAEKYLLSDAADTSVYSSAQGWSDNVMNVAMPSVYVFIDRVIQDLQDIYKKAGVPLKMVHMGGDEVPAGVWEGSPICQALMKQEKTNSVDDLWYYYFRKVNDILEGRGLKMYGWEEIGMRKTMLDGAKLNIPNPDFVKDRFTVDVWNNVLGWGAEDLAYKLANAGYQVVLSPVSNFYFDMAYQKSFDEPGYYWGGFLDVDKPFYFIPYDYFKNAREDLLGNPLDRSIFIGKERLNDYGKTNIKGIQGLIWSENMISPERLEYMLLPKLLGMAERAWAPTPSWSTETDTAKAAAHFNAAWSTFVNTLGARELPRLDYFAGGFNYRIPEPGVIVRDGKVLVNTQYPGLDIRYTTDGSDPLPTSKIYQGPIDDNGKIKVRLFSSTGRGGRISVAR